MTAPRLYVPATIFNVRITGFKNLWVPADTYQGKKQDTPSYVTSCIIPKTGQHWSVDAQMAGFTAACQELYSKAMSHIPFAQVVWPVKDGDIPSDPSRAPAEWMKNHWFLSGSSNNPISVEVVQNGAPVKLVNRAMVKPGDVAAISGVIAVKTNDPRAVKFFVNSVLFMAPGEEIAIGNSVTGAELMEQAKAQGMAITGFTPSHAGSGFGGAPSGGFQQPAVSPPQGGGFGAPSGSFSAPPPAQPPQQGGFPSPNTGFAPPR